MITMENVCKSYRIAKRNAGLKEACKALFHREYEEIQALKNVSFTIKDGEMVGYIGPNGEKLHHQNSQRNIDTGQRTGDGGRKAIVEFRSQIVILQTGKVQPYRACEADRRCLWAAFTVVVGCSGHRFL